MTLTPTTEQVTNPFTNATVTISKVASSSPYFYVRFNAVTKAIVGPVVRIAPGPGKTSTTGGIGGILACDTYANLQAAATSSFLTGSLTTGSL